MRITFMIFFFPLTLFADPAMVQTQEFLKNPESMKQFADKDASAQKAMSDVRKISGGDKDVEKTIYELSAKIFGNFEGKTPEEILKVLNEAQSNPESFFNSLTSEQKQMVREVSLRVPASKVRNP